MKISCFPQFMNLGHAVSKKQNVLLVGLVSLAILIFCGWLYIEFGPIGAFCPTYIDGTGRRQLIIWKVCSTVGSFHNGLAVYSEGQNGQLRYGYIDRNGNIQIRAQYEEAGPFGRSLARIVQDGTEKWIDKDGRSLVTLSPDLRSQYRGNADRLIPVRSLRSNKAGYIDRMGKLVIEPVYAVVMPFSDGLAAVAIEKLDPVSFVNKRFWGFINENGTFVIKPTWSYAESFNEGLALVARETNSDDPAISYRYGFIDKNGNCKIPLVYLRAHSFHSGLASVQTADRKWGFINKQNVFEIKPMYTWALNFSEELAAVRDEHSLWGYIDRQGKWQIVPRYADAGDFVSGLAIVCEQDSYSMEHHLLWGLINKTGKYLIEPDSKKEITDFSEGLVGVYPRDK
ncbi:MAG: WG repeat-containing protein [Candidatus Obscuribacterales bacterium]|nr:WG repeat-containing protein [Candidatus Obscuribacterales bacterium]